MRADLEPLVREIAEDARPPRHLNRLLRVSRDMRKRTWRLRRQMRIYRGRHLRAVAAGRAA